MISKFWILQIYFDHQQKAEYVVIQSGKTQKTWADRP